MGDCKSNFIFALGCLCKCMRNKSTVTYQTNVAPICLHAKHIHAIENVHLPFAYYEMKCISCQCHSIMKRRKQDALFSV